MDIPNIVIFRRAEAPFITRAGGSVGQDRGWHQDAMVAKLEALREESLVGRKQVSP